MNMHNPMRPVTPVEAFEADADAPVLKRQRRRIIIAALVGVAVVGGGWFLTQGGDDQGKAAATAQAGGASIPRVTVVVPGRVMVADEVTVTGSIAARRDMPVGVQGEGGMVTSVLVDAGDYVRAGQVLARIDRAVQEQQVNQLAASVEQARADQALAQSELDRALTLVEKGFISKADIDRRTAKRDADRARVAVAAAQLREAQARLARLDIRAPEDGLVLERMVEPGQVVGAGGPALFRIAENGAMEMRGRVAEQDLPKVKVGQSATATLVGSDRRFDGKVWLIEPIIDPQERQGEARIALSRDPALRPGAFARAKISTGSAERPLLPQSAVQFDDSGSFVLVVGADNKVVRQPVAVGTVNGRGLSIMQGLTGNERVVANAGAFLRPGEKIIPVLAKGR